MMTLLTQLQHQLDDELIGKIGQLLELNPPQTRNSIRKALPELLFGISQSASTEEGAAHLLGAIKAGGHDESLFNRLSDLLEGGKETQQFLAGGQAILTGILGSKLDGMIGSLGRLTGLGTEANTSLLSALGPMLLGKIGGIVKRDELDASGLRQLLRAETEALPATPSPKNVLGVLVWLLPLLIGLTSLCYFFPNQGDKPALTSDQAAMEETAVDPFSKDWQGVNLKLDPAGNLVNEAGRLLAKRGDFILDSEGRILNAEGVVLFSGATFIEEIPSLELGGVTAEKEYYLEE
ncbi:MAG: DUF937 domain-containing protein [Bacteroidota bacterium]